jgi:hypothetical protein
LLDCIFVFLCAVSVLLETAFSLTLITNDSIRFDSLPPPQQVDGPSARLSAAPAAKYEEPESLD